MGLKKTDLHANMLQKVLRLDHIVFFEVFCFLIGLELFIVEVLLVVPLVC